MGKADAGISTQITAPAKVNLFLEVLGRRSDGYHDLESIFQAISIYDTLTITLSEGTGVTLSCSRRDLETGENLAFKAAEVFLAATGLEGAIDIRLEKRIPLQAGLGGGSSDAAAVLVALNGLCGTGITSDELRFLAARVGSDAPFFIEGGTALVRGRGERVEHMDLPGKLYFVVLFPGFGMPTREVYKNLNLKLTRERMHAKVLWDLLSTGELARARSRVFNRLEQPAYELNDRLQQLKSAMRGRIEGAGVHLSGSGASLFSVFADKDRACGAYRAVQAAGLGELFFAESAGRRASTADPKGDSRGDL